MRSLNYVYVLNNYHSCTFTMWWKRNKRTRCEIERKCADVFTGIGCYAKKYKIALNFDVTSVIQFPGNILYSI